jgi:hypothetical protein
MLRRMALPALQVAQVQRWCADRVPEQMRDQVRIECLIGARHLTIVDRRPPWRDDAGAEWSSLPVARLRWTTATRSWTLYWPDRNSNFHRYEWLPPAAGVEPLLAEIDKDPTALFWG